jgi:hypothetical protein
MQRYEGLPLTDDLSPEAIQAEVERILASEKFSRSARLRSLLRFTVAQTLQGNANVLKEYVIGTEVLNKPESYDPRSDSLVRVLASRLRVKLKQYYANGGNEDPLVINFPKGGYVPSFQRREKIRAAAEKKLMARSLYSQAKFRAAQLIPVALSESADALKESIAADPEWSLAHVALAGIYSVQGFFGFARPREVWPAAKAEAEAALQHDEMSSEGHLYLALAQGCHEWHWKDAAIHFAKAIERDSYSGGPYLWRALGYFIPTGRLAEAQQDVQRACELAPTGFMDETYVLALYLLEQHEALLKKTGDLASEKRSTRGLSWLRSLSLAATGSSLAAIKLLEGLAETDPSETRVISALGYLYAQNGLAEKAQAMLELLKGRKREGAWVPNHDFALIHAGLGNRSDAILYLQEAVKEREPWALYLGIDPLWAPWRSAAQFLSLTRRVVPTDLQAASA